MKLEKAASKYIKVIPALSVVFLIVVLAFYVKPRTNLPISTDPSYWGAFGDYVGGILNPILGIFTLFGLAITVWLQKEILETQKQELADTRAELAKSAKALEIQNKTMLAQNFEGTFFQMLRRQSELIEKLEFEWELDPLPIKKGLDAIYFILRSIKKTLSENGTNDFKAAYLNIYQKYNATLGPYFRNLYHNLKLIDENQHLTELEKINYASLARAQLSSYELSLIFYNCLTEYGEGLKPLIIKYRVLKHIDIKLLYNDELKNDANLYPPETYLARV